MLSLFSFRYKPKEIQGEMSEEEVDALNLRLLERINDAGEIYLTQTMHDGRLVIRFVTGAFDCQAEDVDRAFEVITRTARTL